MGKKNSDNDDVKQKFREALERKKAADHDHPDDGGPAGPEAGHEQKATQKRMYRRKAV